MFCFPEDNLNKSKYFTTNFPGKGYSILGSHKGHIKPQSQELPSPQVTEVSQQIQKEKIIVYKTLRFNTEFFNKYTAQYILTTLECKPADDLMPYLQGLSYFILQDSKGMFSL